MTAGRPQPRVLQVVLGLEPGGTERLVVEIVRRLNARIPMRVCCLDTAGAWGEDLRRTGIAVDVLGRQPGFHPALGRRLARLARAHGATVLHAHHYTPFVYSGAARLWRPGLTVVYTEHGRVGDTPPSAKRRLANRLCFAHLPARVFTVSRHLREHLLHEGSVRHRSR